MSFTLTDTELAQIIQNASLAAAEQAAKNVVAELMAKQTIKPADTVTPVVQEATEGDECKVMETMRTILKQYQ